MRIITTIKKDVWNDCERNDETNVVKRTVIFDDLTELEMNNLIKCGKRFSKEHIGKYDPITGDYESHEIPDMIFEEEIEEEIEDRVEKKQIRGQPWTENENAWMEDQVRNQRVYNRMEICKRYRSSFPELSSKRTDGAICHKVSRIRKKILYHQFEPGEAVRIIDPTIDSGIRRIGRKNKHNGKNNLRVISTQGERLILGLDNAPTRIIMSRFHVIPADD